MRRAEKYRTDGGDILEYLAADDDGEGRRLVGVLDRAVERDEAGGRSDPGSEKKARKLLTYQNLARTSS